MPILERVKRIIKANIKELLEQKEPPEATIEQMLEEMRQELREAKIQVAAAIRDKNHLEIQYKESLQKAEKWEKRAVELVKGENDNQAKEALKHKRKFEKIAEDFKKQFEIQKKSVAELKEGLTVLESKIEEAKRKKELLIARKKRAEAQRVISQTMSEISSSNANNVFSKIRNKVVDIEADAQAASEIQKLNLQSQFESLEREDEEDINQELSRLKEEINKN